MRHDNLTVTGQTSILISAIVFLLLLPGCANSANETEELRRYLESTANFDVTDIYQLERGELVSKLLPLKEKHELAFCGVISIGASPEKGFEIFKERLSRLDKKSLMASGSFSDAPTITDLQTLTLEKSDIEALRKCRVGSCDMNLSAEMISRIQNEVEWDGPNYAEQVTALYQRLILEYVLDYRSRGQEALIEYNNKPQAISLRKENEILLRELSWIDSYAPEFLRYLQNSPGAASDIRRSINWGKIKLGLRPVFIITELITFSTNGRTAGNDYLLSVSRQIYASHFLDSSLGLIALMRDPRSDTSDSSYLLYVNHSRSPALRGVFGKFIRKLVEPEVMEKLKLLLQNTKAFADYDRTKKELPPPVPTPRDRVIYWMSKYPYLIGLLILIATLMIINRVRRTVMK